MINIALLGFGVIGSGTAKVLTDSSAEIAAVVGDDIYIKYIVDLRDFPGSPFESRIIKNFNIVLNDPEVQIVVEMFGGSHPAYDYSLAALRAGKNVITSNKEVVSNFGDELLREAAAHGCRYLIEASVGGGIPLIRPLSTSFVPGDIYEIAGILNGTTNYILTSMTEAAIRGKPIYMKECIAEAQRLGYAESDPSADVEGVDACRKISILTALAFGKLVSPDRISTKGITGITAEDIRSAVARGNQVKLIGRAAKLADGRVYASVAPCEVPPSCPLSHVNDVFNAVLVRGRALGDVIFYGRGAGSLPTATAVVSDIIDIASNIGHQPTQVLWDRADYLYTDKAPDDGGFVIL